MASKIQLARGAVYLVRFRPPDRPSETIDKYFLCSQEGKIVKNSPAVVGVILTTQNPRPKYPWDVHIPAAECGEPNGVRAICSQIHTIPKDQIIGYKYMVSEATMDEVDNALVLGVGFQKIEDIER